MYVWRNIICVCFTLSIDLCTDTFSHMVFYYKPRMCASTTSVVLPFTFFKVEALLLYEITIARLGVSQRVRNYVSEHFSILQNLPSLFQENRIECKNFREDHFEKFEIFTILGQYLLTFCTVWKKSLCHWQRRTDMADPIKNKFKFGTFTDSRVKKPSLWEISIGKYFAICTFFDWFLGVVFA